jgi:hypothetical protein
MSKDLDMPRFQLKVWTSPTGVRYPVGLGMLVDMNRISATVIGANTVQFVSFTVDEWNKLPIFWFKEDGVYDGPRPSTEIPSPAKEDQ